MYYSDRKQKLKEVFYDTQRFYTEDAVLAASVRESMNNTKLYEAEDYPKLPLETKKQGEVFVVKAKTFETAMRLHGDYPDKKIAVLNFASATNPGGGVKNGSSAQEESLCRCSTLYPTLTQDWLLAKFYEVNWMAHDPLHSDACIYSPDIIICKTDESIPERMPRRLWTKVDIITCAAPNLRNIPSNIYNPESGRPVKIEPQRLYELHVKRAKHIMHLAAANDADILILGAFGCGAFENDPVIVAKAYHTALEDYRDKFDKVVFAIYCRDYETKNFDAFEKEIKNI